MIKAHEPGRVLISRDEVSASIAYAIAKQWKVAPSPINAVFVIDRFIERMINGRSNST